MRSFWNFAVTRILGEMRDELRRLDYLTRTQRSKVSEDDRGVPALADDELEWVVPLEPLSLEGTVAADGDDTSALVDSVAEPRDPIAELELRDAVDRAGDRLPRHVRQIVAKRDIEGYTNAEVAEALDLSPGRVSQLRDAAFAKMRGHIGDSLRDAA
jgi:RNA polymerase sigma factor (sigma-70 family)